MLESHLLGGGFFLPSGFSYWLIVIVEGKKEEDVIKRCFSREWMWRLLYGRIDIIVGITLKSFMELDLAEIDERVFYGHPAQMKRGREFFKVIF